MSYSFAYYKINEKTKVTPPDIFFSHFSRQLSFLLDYLFFCLSKDVTYPLQFFLSFEGS